MRYLEKKICKVEIYICLNVSNHGATIFFSKRVKCEGQRDKLQEKVPSVFFMHHLHINCFRVIHIFVLNYRRSKCCCYMQFKFSGDN